ncbi:hypothetical protein BJ322DRAFT_1020941 [Thelephora terrestris]|uniref:Uncharacterized protein n=1 Tax=Thelephora terrestris TaxID=56493 RepID=A0A9P6L7B7_9AGAM|nr:hypothetical protein BJ322DRAFT_1020941 [Thelephora terrestris]
MDKQQDNSYHQGKVVKNKIHNPPANTTTTTTNTCINQHAEYIHSYVNFDPATIHGKAQTNPAQTSREAQTGGEPPQVRTVRVLSFAHDIFSDGFPQFKRKADAAEEI